MNNQHSFLQKLLTAILTVAFLIPIIILLIRAFDYKIDTYSLRQLVGRFIFIILSYGIGALIAGFIFSRIHINKYIACAGSLASIVICAILLPPIFMTIVNTLFSMLGILGLLIAFSLAILLTYLSTCGVFLFFAVSFNTTLEPLDKFWLLAWIQEEFKDKKGA